MNVFELLVSKLFVLDDSLKEIKFQIFIKSVY